MMVGFWFVVAVLVDGRWNAKPKNLILLVVLAKYSARPLC